MMVRSEEQLLEMDIRRQVGIEQSGLKAIIRKTEVVICSQSSMKTTINDKK